jgi:hypothetical protein
VEEPGGRVIRGVLEEVSFISTERGTFRRLTIRDPQAVDRETGYVIQVLRSCYFSQVCHNGAVVSETELQAMRGSRLEIRFLADNACEIRVVS